jgi:iron complex outermembrane receptor protein
MNSHRPQFHRLRNYLAVRPLALVVSGMFASAAAAQEAAIQEVIITAQKTAQPASKTPIALSVIGADDLRKAGASDPTALTELAPNVQISTYEGKLQIAIRGVASLDMTDKGDPSTAFNVDGAYIGRPEQQAGSFLDLERIEILRGPQGTLYGRNATAGAINLITNKPGKTFEGKVNLDVGNYNTRRAEGMLNVPINDALALRAALSVNRRDTYLNPGQNTVPLEDQDDRAARLHALWTMAPGTTLLLTAEHNHVGGAGTSPLPLRNFFSGTNIAGGNNLANPVYVDKGSDAQLTVVDTYINHDAHKNNVANGQRAEFKTGVAATELTYQFYRLKAHTDTSSNGAYFGFPFYSLSTGDSEQTSHELRFNSVGESAVKWVAGLFKYDEEVNRVTTYNTKTPGPTIVVPFRPNVNNHSKAAFAQASYAVVPDLRLTIGLRTTRDGKDGSDPLAGSATGPGYVASVSSSKFNYRIGADYDVSRAVMLYTSLSTGYKAGGFNDTDATPYQPEVLTSFEAGVKGRFFDNTLRLSLGAFAYDYKNLQLTAIVCKNNSATSCGSLTTNAANASVRGAELEGSYSLTRVDKFVFGLAATDAHFKDYRPSTTVDWADQKLDRAPGSIASVGYTRTFTLDNGADIQAGLTTRYSSAYFISDPSAAVRYEQPAFWKTDLSASYASARGNLTLQLYVKNLENYIAVQSKLPGSVTVSAPRTIGMRAGTTF